MPHDFKIDFLKRLETCELCLEPKYLEEMSRYIPEPLIGSWHPTLAIIGTNPGEYGVDPAEFGTTFVEYYLNRRLDSNTTWERGYVEAYFMLMEPKNASRNGLLYRFNANAAILNVIKCATPNSKDISIVNLENAKNNCLKYLLTQIEYMQPNVILSHGRFACDTTLELLGNGHFGVCDVAAANRIMQLPMDEKSNELLIANQNGRETLFLFNRHLSIFGPAIKALNSNLEEKRRVIGKFIK
jgi:hypothetical protein